ncbi:MAG: hypothetical protein ABIF85_03570 [Nanoarchaeota archaeon]|nr:hypothetical protein [Nanoarchaeota archaeon]MBU4300821.1 hypothetical protein [Nanoarchaeota archaeon]MBU4451496.1 hypothetical protein [Nanoarchaeota archaeon]MCG2723853.1 hypothetical protein [archaeon]
MSTKKEEVCMILICQVKNMKCFDINRKTVRSFSKTIEYSKAKETAVRAFLKKISK